MGKTLAGVEASGPYVPDAQTTRAMLISNAVYAPTERFLSLDRREAFWKTLEYEHQNKDWWGRNADQYETISPRVTLPQGFEYADPKADIFVRDKRPTAPLRTAKTIVDRFTGMLLSNDRKPEIHLHEDPDSEDALKEVVRGSGFWTQMRNARSIGGGMGSAMVTVHLRDGQFCYEVHNPKNLETIIWADRRSWAPLGVLKMYTYPVPENVVDKNGKIVGVREVEYLYRRIITAWEDVVFKPARLDTNGQIPWDIDPALYVYHGLGFFPGVWIQNTPSNEEMDGDPDCEGAWQMIDTIDRIVAQTNKGVLLNIDPTIILAYDAKKVGEKEVKTGSDYAIHLPEGGTGNYLELRGEAVRAGIEFVNFLRSRVQDLTRCVLIDPEKITGSAQSAKAMEFLFAPMIERTDEFRGQYGEGFTKLLNITSRMARTFQGKQVQMGIDPQTQKPLYTQFRLNLPKKVTKTQIDGKERIVVTERKFGPGGSIELAWGPYFAPTETDKQQRITNAAAAKQSGLVTGLTATKYVSPVFDIDDPEAENARAEQEENEKAERALVGLDAGIPAMPGAGEGGQP